MDRTVGETSAFLNLFDIVATTATGIAAPVIGTDDIVDGDTGADGGTLPEFDVISDDQANF